MSDTPTIRALPGLCEKGFKQVYIPPFRLPISVCTQDELFEEIAVCRTPPQKMLIDNVNMDILWYAQRDEVYREALSQLSSVNLVDGVPVRWLTKMAGVRVPQRLALTDVVPALLRFATEKDYSVFVVGSNPNTLLRAKGILQEQNSLPPMMASWAQPREKLLNEEVNANVLALLQEVQPDILFVAMGSPFQTKWIARNWESLPNSIIVPVGGAFDYIAGSVGRAPGWMQAIGMEWMYRLLFDHQKRERSLFKRYIMTDLPFALQMAFKIRQFRRRSRRRERAV